MENKINVAELLKNCPKGMELDCTMYDGIHFDGINDSELFPITITRPDTCKISLTKYGQYTDADYAKCVIFPKGKTTWEGFVPPCKFKDGDVIFTHANCLSVGLGNTWISIYKENRNGGVATYIDYAEDGSGCYSDLDGDKALLCMERDIMRQRIATEEEKEKLFQAIKDNGYKWNKETKTLEKLVNKNKFAIGDTITNGKLVGKIRSRDVDSYQLEDGTYVFFNEVHNWELVPNKFDISTYKEETMDNVNHPEHYTSPIKIIVEKPSEITCSFENNSLHLQIKET